MEYIIGFLTALNIGLIITLLFAKKRPAIMWTYWAWLVVFLIYKWFTAPYIFWRAWGDLKILLG